MQAATDSQSLGQKIWIRGGFRKKISRDPFLYKDFFVLRQVHITAQPLHGLLHRPVVDLRLGPGLPEVAHGYLLVLLVEKLLPPPIAVILRGEKVIVALSLALTNVIMQAQSQLV